MSDATHARSTARPGRDVSLRSLADPALVLETVAQVLDCLRNGTCAPGGEEGSSAKLAHTFYSVAVT